MGGDSWTKDHGFKSQHRVLDGYFITLLCCKNCNVCFKIQQIECSWIAMRLSSRIRRLYYWQIFVLLNKLVRFLQTWKSLLQKGFYKKNFQIIPSFVRRWRWRNLNWESQLKAPPIIPAYMCIWTNVSQKFFFPNNLKVFFD